MSKVSTLTIQDQLVEVGEQLGFRAMKEYSFARQYDYNPRYDVVWLLDVGHLHIGQLQGVELIDEQWLPFATFEIEGSTTSSKNQVGNVGNLYISPCQFHFIIVANREAAKENDTYRRGVKIVRTMQELLGYRQLLFLDATMIPNGIAQQTVAVSDGQQMMRAKGSGGETTSLAIAEVVLEKLARTKLSVSFDRVPDYFSMQFQARKGSLVPNTFLKDPVSEERKPITSLSQYYYCPKIDMSAGFYLTGGFVIFLRKLAFHLGEDAALYPLLHMMATKRVMELYYPLLGIEIESGNSKHAIGGLVNAGRLHQVGWIVGPETMRGAVDLYQHHLGMRNTYFISRGEL